MKTERLGLDNILLEDCRTIYNLSLKDAAEGLSISPSTLERYEQYATDMEIKTVYKILWLYGLGYDEIAWGTEYAQYMKKGHAELTT